MKQYNDTFDAELLDVLNRVSEHVSALKESGVREIFAARRPGQREVSRALAEITKRVSLCELCPLHKTRTNTVPGQGNSAPEIMFVGEAPGADEDLQGVAFIGRAGQLLTKIIAAMGLTREQVFIGNILKCRPPNNRKPEPSEMAVCLPFLREQIALLVPKVIITLGATALEGLLQIDTVRITKMRGQWREFDGIPLMPTFHPSYLLHNPAAKSEVWMDMQSVLKRLGRSPPPRKKTPATS